jgi:O-antigen biosynthesis protein
MQVCFLVAELGLAGGVAVIVEHARRLVGEHDIGVTLVLLNPAVPDWARERLDGVRVSSLEQARPERFDLAVATYWRTAYHLFEVAADRHAYFVQSLEDRFYRPGDVERLGASVTYDLPVAFLTEASWIARLLGELRPEAPVRVVPNGIDKRRFAIPERPPERPDGPLRVLVEGHPGAWYKGVPEALAAVERMSEAAEVTLVTPQPVADANTPQAQRTLVGVPPDEMPGVYAETDVVLKLSRVEGVPLPPLEGFHLGATCVVTPVTGVEEYVVHGRNGVVVDFDDLAGTARWLDLLARDRTLLGRLREGALATAREWPSWEESAGRMAEAMRELMELPPVPAAAGAAALLRDVEAGSEELRRHALGLRRAVELSERNLLLRDGDVAWREQLLEWERQRVQKLEATLAEIRATPSYRVANAVRQARQDPRRALTWPARAAKRRAR